VRLKPVSQAVGRSQASSPHLAIDRGALLVIAKHLPGSAGLRHDDDTTRRSKGAFFVEDRQSHDENCARLGTGVDSAALSKEENTNMNKGRIKLKRTATRIPLHQVYHSNRKFLTQKKQAERAP